MRSANRESRIPDPVRLLYHWRKLFWLSVSIGIVMVADVVVAKYGPGSRAATIETGASFSVSAGSFATEAKAATFAGALDASGLPMLVRMRPDDGRYQVLVGPYVTTDEAERAQRKLSAWGVGEARFVVDDTMRARPQEAAVFGLGQSAEPTSVVLIAAGSMSSIVFELPEMPKEVELRRSGVTSLDVVVGRSPASALEPLSLPDGVSLVRDLAVGTDGGALHAHVGVPANIESRLRLEGKRVYLDLAFPKAPWAVVARAPERAPGVAEHQAATEAAPVTSAPAELRAIAERLKQMEPFLTSAAAAPEPDVLTALSKMLFELQSSIAAVPHSSDPFAQTLAAAAARAAAAVAPSFRGDRVAGVREAIALIESVPVPPQ